jgi:hypothetical protein
VAQEKQPAARAVDPGPSPLTTTPTACLLSKFDALTMGSTKTPRRKENTPKAKQQAATPQSRPPVRCGGTPTAKLAASKAATPPVRPPFCCGTASSRPKPPAGRGSHPYAKSHGTSLPSTAAARGAAAGALAARPTCTVSQTRTSAAAPAKPRVSFGTPKVRTWVVAIHAKRQALPCLLLVLHWLAM